MFPLKDNIPTDRPAVITMLFIAANVLEYFLLQRGVITSGPDDGFVESHDAQAILLGRLNKLYGSGSGPIPQAYKGRVGFIAD